MRVLDRFLQDRSGNFAMMVGILLPGLLMTMGGAIDLSQTYRAGARIQNAVDAAALAVARMAPGNQAEAEAIAQTYFSANFGGELPLDVTLRPDNVLVVADYEMPTAFLGLAGIGELTVQRSSMVKISMTTMELALVLDTTGSMEGKKLTDMKDAVTKLIGDLSKRAASNHAELRVSLVPFSSMVNAGKGTDGSVRSFVDATGAANPHMSEFPVGFSRLALYDHLAKTWPGCVESRPNGLDVLDTPPNAADPRTLFVPSFNSDEPDPLEIQYWGRWYKSYKYPNDFVRDNDGAVRLFDIDYNYFYNNKSSTDGTLLKDILRVGKKANGNNFRAADHPLARYGVTFEADGRIKPKTKWNAPSFTPAYRFFSNVSAPQGPENGCVSGPVIPLTTDIAKIETAVKGLVAAGGTNIVEGAAWGWRTLSPEEPFTEGKSYDDVKNAKIMVLLTDGANDLTVLDHAKGSAYTSYGYLNDGLLSDADGKAIKKKSDVQEEMDNRVLKICERARDKGINVFTILLEVNDAASSKMLEECASSTDQFYDARVSSRLASIFDDIKGKISQLRIAR